MISYQHCGLTPFAIKVILDGKPVGMIRRDNDGYYYTPRKSSAQGDRFATVERCKESLEAA